MIYIRLFLRLNIYYIHLHSCQYHGGTFVDSSFVQQVLIFFQYQSGLQVDYHNACW